MSTPAIDKPKVYLYKMEIRDLQLKDVPLGKEADWATKQIAALLKTEGLVEKALDLQSKGSHYNSTTIYKQTIFLVMAQSLSKHFISTMQNKIQQESSNPQQVQCPVTLQTIDEPYFAVVLCNENGPRKPQEIFFANVCTTIPRLTDGPVTGCYKDSWNGAIRTPQAREWLNAHNIDPQRVEWIRLTDATHNDILTLGAVS